MTQRLALVTGGAGGIGTAICRQLAADGRRIVTTCVDPEAENIETWVEMMRGEGIEVDWVQCDVSDNDACVKMAETVQERFGTVDILVNVAGITSDGFLHKMPADSWQKVIDINLSGVFNVTHQFVGAMRQQGFGRVVNISSVNGQTGQFGQTNYSAAKAGMHGFTMALAKEGAPKGVTANTVSPGYVKTSMTDAMPDKVREGIVSQIPAGDMGQPEDIARAVAFLTADEAGYINGANLPVNGALFCSF
ncbi:acetoacetyl-CoA reductase [Spiribacter vilamensis]|uniref:3-oxoacyl-[acyl-carrier-protein] reductase n=1 Tax=Spiribacter vilamensis TaxID=531306 RepID=A0A4Q8D165_9GAMM|nr:acetoacetyl-CoA reductase [Spiribacter vilamensis]RZU99058.1 3-oxoacyl-[acyl-carrier-protein] reductase [Spiribacter vilamensis]TVO61943.1 acetoacetyl-CoA reductase [Spiribacter vilamensis]